MGSLYKNGVLYLMATLSVKAAQFLILPFYSYLVSPKEYGYVYIISSFIQFSSLMITFSLQGAVSRFYYDCESVDDIRKMYSTIVWFVTALAAMIVLPLYLCDGYIASFLDIPVLYLDIAIASTFLLCYYSIITALLYAKQEAKKISITTTIMGIVQICVQLTLVLSLNDKAFALISSQLICASITFVIFLIYSKPYLARLFDFQKISLYLKYSLSQLPSDVSVMLLSMSDRMIINKLKGSSVTGIYGMGQTLGHIPGIAVGALHSAYTPFVMTNYKRMKNNDPMAEKELVRHTSIYFSIVTVIFSMVVLFSNNIVMILNERYVDSAVIMVVVLFSMMMDLYRRIFMNPMVYNIRYIKIKSAIWVFAAILNIVLNLILIPRYSMYGACWAMLVSYFTSTLLILYYSDKAMHINYETKKMLGVLATSICFGGFFLWGTSLLALVMKVLLSVIYVYVVSRIIKINLWNITLKTYNSFVNHIKIG